MEDQGRGIEELVHAGITAAKAGQRSEARSLLTEAVERAPQNVQAWLWLSGVVDTPQDQEHCLHQVLDLVPEHVAAHKGLALVQSRMVTTSLEAGIAAAKAGEEEQARQLLLEAIERDDENLDAWLWLARVVDSVEDCEICYENVLMLDPDNIEAKQALTRLRQDVKQEIEEQEQPSPPPDSDPWARLENEYDCPYCLAPTEPKARRCSTCGKKLWIKVRRKAERSTSLWILLALQIFQTLVTGAVALIAVYFISQLVSGEGIPQMLTLLLQTQYNLSPEIISTIADAWIYVTYLLFFIPFIFSTVILIGLYLRWPVIFYLLLIQAGFGFISSGFNLILSSDSFAILPAALGALISLGYFFFVLRLEDDFIPDKRRILLRLDHDVREGVEFLRRGQDYASLKMWALSALHFRHAAARLRTVDAYIALTIACIKLKAYGLAERALKEAESIAPGHTDVAEFKQILEERRVDKKPSAATPR